MLPDVLVSGSDSWRSVAEKLMSICLRVQRSAAKSHKPQAPDVVSGVREYVRTCGPNRPNGPNRPTGSGSATATASMECLIYASHMSTRRRKDTQQQTPHRIRGEGSTTGTCPSISHVPQVLAKNLIKLHAAQSANIIIIMFIILITVGILIILDLLGFLLSAVLFLLWYIPK